MKKFIETVPINVRREYVASEQARGMPKHKLQVGVAWIIVYEGQKSQEIGNHATNTEFANWTA